MLLTISIIVILGIFLNELSKKYSLESLIYKRNFSKNLVEIGEEFDVECIVENKKMLPVTFLQINEEYPSIIEYKNRAFTKKTLETMLHSMTMIILPYQRVKRKYKVSASKRGRYLCKDVSLITGDILGLKVFNETLPFLQEIVVFPRSISLDEELIPYGDFYGDISVKRWIIEDPIVTVGIREYTGTEPQKTIHWPSSLKGGRLMVKKFDYTTDNKVMLVLNVESYKPFWTSIDHVKIEKCISFVRVIAEELEEKGISYGFESNGQIMGESNDKVIMPGWGSQHFNDIIERLGRIDYSINIQFENMILDIITMNIKYGTYIMVMPYILDEYVEPINILSNQCEKFIIISIEGNNMGLLNDKIIKYVKRGDES
ncbi:MAG: hypothetical protein K0R09_1801 [Clostridiales bacterium]|jgi:uncharacterized protein (DUF58 family)|nr:hypothetical protein [Clostridiales bacterium]